MTPEAEAKIDSILISAVNRLYTKEERLGLEFEDLRCLEIIYKIAKEAKNSSPTSSGIIPSTSVTPANLLDMLKAARGVSGDSESQ